MITQSIKLYEEPVKVVTPPKQSYNSGYYNRHSYSLFTYEEVMAEIKRSKELGLIFGVKFCYKANPSRILTICGFEYNTQYVDSINGCAGVILARDMTNNTSGTFHYSVDEILTSTALEIVQ